jgi:hypothetical protein
VTPAPPISGEALRAHDLAVRGLAEQAEAFLPARFGQMFADRTALLEAVGPRKIAFCRGAGAGPWLFTDDAALVR